MEVLRKIMQSEMLKLLDEQQAEENKRKKMLHGINKKEKNRLEKIFAIERAKESNDIVILST